MTTKYLSLVFLLLLVSGCSSKIVANNPNNNTNAAVSKADQSDTLIIRQNANVTRAEVVQNITDQGYTVSSPEINHYLYIEGFGEDYYHGIAPCGDQLDDLYAKYGFSDELDTVDNIMTYHVLTGGAISFEDFIDLLYREHYFCLTHYRWYQTNYQGEPSFAIDMPYPPRAGDATQERLQILLNNLKNDDAIEACEDLSENIAMGFAKCTFTDVTAERVHTLLEQHNIHTYNLHFDDMFFVHVPVASSWADRQKIRTIPGVASVSKDTSMQAL